jgi:membrane carboxypeptidase/penicillin-binding protein
VERTNFRAGVSSAFPRRTVTPVGFQVMLRLHFQVQACVAVVRIFLKALLALTAFAAVVISVCLCWFSFYSGDLPNFSALAKFAPDSPATVVYQCSNSPVQVIPSTLVSKNLQNAARAAEGKNGEVLARQISFDLFCDSQTRMLKRHLLEFKASIQLRRRFTSEQLLTIYLNRAHFGNDLIGVESASLHYFGKRASELDIPQAALIAGLIKGPSRYSPERHPDRAKERRDEVIGEMLRNGSITAEQAAAAQQSAIR